MTSGAHQNNFDVLRLLFAGAVFLWHAHVLPAFSLPASISALLSLGADWGVKGFFVVSGYLIMQSYDNSRSVREYAGKRLRRIYPAYVTVVVLGAAIGAALTRFPLSEYLSGALLQYLVANLLFLNFLAPTLPGVFEGHVVPEVNGALWTLKIEVMFYALLPALVWTFARLGKGRMLTLLYILSLLYSVSLCTLYETTGRGIWLQLQRQLPGQLTYFIVGIAHYAYRDILARHGRTIVVAAVVVLAVVRALDCVALAIAAEPLALGALVVFAAIGVRFLGNAARFGDFSYGLYIFHFPVLQALIALGVFGGSPTVALLASAFAVILVAALSWHLVERPFLSARSHYRIAESSHS
ncbi:MAG: acyltransferase [Betaproteobacteria bacterium]|nr:MAG: acyltransferase [Betaproteobacteria bacterium]